MNKVDFPIGVELPLRGDGVAVLYEFFENRWYGRMKAARNACRWVEMAWQPDGESGAFSPDDDSANYNILPPKRKAWVCWSPDDGATLFKDELVVMAIKANSPELQWQEITEP